MFTKISAFILSFGTLLVSASFAAEHGGDPAFARRLDEAQFARQEAKTKCESRQLELSQLNEAGETLTVPRIQAEADSACRGWETRAEDYEELLQRERASRAPQAKKP